MSRSDRDAPTVPPAPPPGQRKGYGGLPIPPRRDDLPRAAPVHEDTLAGSPAPPYRRIVTPTPWESPVARKRVEEDARRHGDAVVEPPVSVAPPPLVSLSPAPESVGAIRVQAGGVDVRIGSTPVKKAWPFIVAFIVTTVGGAVVGYYQGLRRAGDRQAALEERQRLDDERNSRQDVRLEAAERSLDRVFVVLRDHDARLPQLKTELEQVRGAQPRIQGLPQK